MPYKSPGLSSLIAQTEQNIQQRLPGSWPQAAEKTLNALAYAQGGLAAGVHEGLAWVSRQIIASDADEAELLKHCQFWGVRRKQASRAAGDVVMTVTAAVTIPAQTRWQRGDGELFINPDDASATTAGALTVPLQAVNAGAESNTPENTPLTLVTPIEGVVAQGVTPAGIAGGADIEAVSELLSRLLFRVQYPPFGGNKFDYVRWARECSGVTRAWCLPTWQGGGTVGVGFVMDNNADIFPTQADIDRVADYIEAHPDPVTGLTVGAPDGVIVTVFQLTPKPVDMQIYISPNTAELQKAVSSELTSLFYNEAIPGGSMPCSHLIRAIARSSRLDDFRLESPVETVYSAATELLTLGKIEWV